ncbi:hypothetical protein WMF38_57625 [Sorangium sp. So ce118]
MLTRDSDGKIVPAYQPNWHWLPDGEEQIIEVHDDHEGETGYTPEIEAYERFGRLSRVLQEVSRKDMLAYGVLEAYYGDRGNRWREASKDRWDDVGKKERSGYGPGAIAAVYICTERGDKFLHSAQKALNKGRAVEEHRKHDDVLDIVLIQQAAQPDAVTRERLGKVRDEAEELLRKARSVYLTEAAKTSRRHGGGAT